MKRDRLYGITIYLLNHGRTSAKTLAEYFEVSVGYGCLKHGENSYYCLSR